MTVHAGGSSGGTPREACVAPPVANLAATGAVQPTATARGAHAAVITLILAVAALALVVDTWPPSDPDRVIASSVTASVASSPPAPRRVMVPAHRIDIDRADLAELSLLPEIGPALAARIAADRAVRGAFGSIDALARVEGIGPARIVALRAVATASGVAGVRGEDAEAHR